LLQLLACCRFVTVDSCHSFLFSRTLRIVSQRRRD
jgi:hypothetical protein